MRTYQFHICLYYDVFVGRGRINGLIADSADKDAFHGAVAFFAVLFQQVKPVIVPPSAAHNHRGE